MNSRSLYSQNTFTLCNSTLKKKEKYGPTDGWKEVDNMTEEKFRFIHITAQSVKTALMHNI